MFNWASSIFTAIIEDHTDNELSMHVWSDICLVAIGILFGFWAFRRSLYKTSQHRGTSSWHGTGDTADSRLDSWNSWVSSNLLCTFGFECVFFFDFNFFRSLLNMFVVCDFSLNRSWFLLQSFNFGVSLIYISLSIWNDGCSSADFLAVLVHNCSGCVDRNIIGSYGPVNGFFRSSNLGRLLL